jgi:hypothetical protein
MGYRIIPAALASSGFLVTFTIRSWHEDLWHTGRAADYVTVSATQQPAIARSTSVAAPLESVLRQEAARLRAAMPAAPSAVAPAASDYLFERDREASHSGRLR